MDRTTSLIAAALALSVAAAVPAQSLVRVIGTVRATAQGFRLDETDMEFVGGSVDLRRFQGHIAEITGTIRDDLSPPVFEVGTAELARCRFQSSGDTRIGQDLQLRVDVPDIGRWYLYMSFGAGMMPLESYMPYGSGTLWLDPASMATLGLGPMVRTWMDRITVPNEPALVGLSVYLQGAVHIEPGPLLFLNANRVTLLP